MNKFETGGADSKERPETSSANVPASGYSFCIITNGKRPAKLAREIESIVALGIPDFEILIGGEVPPDVDRSRFRVVDMPDAARGGRLGEMRNALCRSARFDHLVVADDDLIFHPDFHQGLLAYGEDFDTLCVRLLNPDGTRHWDWATHGGPTGHHLLPYHAEDPNVYITGGLCVMKAAVFQTVQWDEGRGFYQGEDLDFSERLKRAGFRIRYCAGSTVTHDDPQYTQVGNVVHKMDSGQNIHVTLDITVLGVAHAYDRARTGIYRYVDSLMRGLDARNEVKLTLVSNGWELEAATAFLRTNFDTTPPYKVGTLHATAGSSLLHSPFSPLPHLHTPGPRVLTIHDLIPIKFPQYFEFNESHSIRSAIASVSGDTFVIVNSEATKADLLAYAPHISDDRVVVTPLAADRDVFYFCQDTAQRARVLEKYKIEASCRYLLSVATLEPRKNIVHLVRAFVKLLKADPTVDLKLVLVGTKGWKFEPIFQELALAADMQARFILTGFVPDSDLAALYSSAVAFVYPSLYEGFGFPPLEAMQCGTPVIASDNSSLPEVVGDAGILVGAQDEDALISAIRSLYFNPELRRELTQRGLARAASFTWERCVDLTVATYAKALEQWKAKAAAPRERPGTIVVDAVFFQMYQTGIARVWRSLLREWSATEFGKRLLVLDRGKSAPRFDGIRYLDFPRYDYAHTDLDRVMLQHVCDSEHAALFVSSYYTTPFKTPSVMMVHDMIPELIGADFQNDPMWREKRHGTLHASHYLSVSNNTAKDLRHFFPAIPAERITVAHNGVDFTPPAKETVAAFLQQQKIERPYFLLVGGRNGNKNGILFFKAFASLGAVRARYAIVCTGPASQLEPEYAACLGGAAVHMLQLTDDELQSAYAGAQALVYPSLYEGFGMPIVEAMACGCPVITTRRGAIPEVAGDAALYVEVNDAPGLSRALKQVQNAVVRKRLIAAGLERAKRFSWTRMATEVQRALESTAASPGSWHLHPLLRDHLIEMAMQRHQAGKLDDAENYYRQILTFIPDDFAALHMLGVVRWQLGDHSNAEELLLRVRAMGEAVPEVHVNLGNVYVAQGRDVEARACFERALALDPTFSLAAKRLAALGPTSASPADSA